MAQNPQRRYDIDWLRIFATLAVFFFHNARFFDTIDWHIKNAEPSEGMFILVAFLNAWIMPIFFLLSGAGSWFGLEHRNWRQYLLDRGKRLLIPFYTVGALILIPPQYYWDRVTKGIYSGSFVDFYPKFFNTVHIDFPFLSFWSGHLWFLPFYILHQTIILFVGWYIIPLDMLFLLKYLIISTVSFILIMLIYEVCIKRLNMVRFLFGMRIV